MHIFIFFSNIFFEEILSAERSRSKIISGDSSCNLSVHLFWPRTVYVMCSEPCFNMPHWDLLIERRQSCSGAGCGISMYEYHIWLNLSKDISHSDEHTCCNIIEILSLFHNVEIVVRFDVKNGKYLI